MCAGWARLKAIRPGWSLIGLVGAAFTIITAGIGLIQARISTIGIIYGNAAQASNNTDLTQAFVRLEQQSNLYQPLGMFLVTLGLAMLFSTAVWIGVFSLSSSQATELGKKPSTKSFSKSQRATNIVPISLAIAIMLASYLLFIRVQLAANNLVKVVADHPSFIVGFIVLSLLFYAVLDIVNIRLIQESA